MSDAAGPRHEFIVREASAADAHDVAVAHVAAWRAGYDGVIPHDVLWADEMSDARHRGWQRRLTDGPPPGAGDPDNRIIVAETDGSVVGFGHAGMAAERAPDDDTAVERIGEVYAFYVHPEWWGSGAADALMDECRRELARRGFDAAVLWVLRDNPRARRFYERAGWAPTGRELSWEGAMMPGMPVLEEPVAQVQYRLELRG